MSRWRRKRNRSKRGGTVDENHRAIIVEQRVDLVSLCIFIQALLLVAGVSIGCDRDFLLGPHSLKHRCEQADRY